VWQGHLYGQAMGAPTAQLSLVQLGLQHTSAHVQALEVSLRQGTQKTAGKPGSCTLC